MLFLHLFNYRVQHQITRPHETAELETKWLKQRHETFDLISFFFFDLSFI